MRINVHVKTGKKQQYVLKKDNGEFDVWIKAKPVKGAANKELLTVLSDYFKAKHKNISIVRGLTSSRKIIDVIN